MPTTSTAEELLPYTGSPELVEVRRCLVVQALSDMPLVRERTAGSGFSSHIYMQPDIWSAIRLYGFMLERELFEVGDAAVSGLAAAVLQEDSERAATYRDMTARLGLAFSDKQLRQVSAQQPLALPSPRFGQRAKDTIKTRNTRVIIAEHEAVAGTLRPARRVA